MPPSQGSRLDTVEETIETLQHTIPELENTIDERFEEMKQYLERKQAEMRGEQNRRFEESSRGQEELKSAITLLMTEVKGISEYLEGNRDRQRVHGGTLREESPGHIIRGLREESHTEIGEERPTGEKRVEAVPTEGTNWRLRRLEFPVFNGDDPDGWIVKIEHSFDFYQLPEKEKLDAAVVGLEGKALLWYQWVKKRKIIRSWGVLKKMMLRHFRGRKGGSLIEQWMTIQQDGSVEDYENKFIQFASNLENEPGEDYLLANFIRGLDPRIQVELRLMDPVTMEEAMEWAVKVEEKLLVAEGPVYPLKYHNPKTPYYQNPNRTITLHKNPTYPQNFPHPHNQYPKLTYPSQPYPHKNTQPNTSSNHRNQNTHQTRRLSDREFQEKRDKGLCFRCDEKWRMGHICKRKELSVLIVNDEEPIWDESDDEAEPEKEAVEEPVNISLNSVVGIDNPRTMKLCGTLKGEKVVVMIDPGATHNFIAPSIVAKLELPVTNTEEFGVTLGTGEVRKGYGVCKDVELDLGAIRISENFLPLELGHSDAILGLEWLAKLGTISTNWRAPMMQFVWQGSKVTLKGDPTLERSQITLKSMMKTIRKNKGGLLLEVTKLAHMAVTEEMGKPMAPTVLEPVLDRFASVFQMPKGLPPLRSRQHRITLKEGTNPVNVRPYRYPQIQKEEMEKLVTDMLDAGIIQPSCSPFSSPVLLVKKKDGSWRFCVDYRALNRETVADKYPIPVIEELLDELHGAKVLWACFDKIELSSSDFKRVLLLGYTNGFQVLDVDDASIVTELVSKRDGPCTFLQIQPFPAKSEGCEGFSASHPLLLVAAGDETMGPDPTQRRDGVVRDGYVESQAGNLVYSPTAVRFYSIRSHNDVHVLRFRSAVYTIRCSPRIVAVGLASQIYCVDALTLEKKFSVLTYPVPQLAIPGTVGINVGYGPMAVGPRWLAYPSNNPLLTNTGRLSPQNLSPSPGVSPSTSPSNGTLIARYAMESSKQLAAGLINIGDKGYKTFSKYCHELLPDGSSSPLTNSGWRVNKTSSYSPDPDTAGMVIVEDFVSRAVIAQFRAHTSPISALCFDPSGTLLVTASIHGNNINVFRIMPSNSKNGAGCQSYNWTSSHVHLYKLHRGFTSAVIQDICFSQYSQWVAIVSSKGTCHIYVLSPFGGDCGLQIQNSHIDGPMLVPGSSLPWWSASSCTINQQSLSALPPPTVTLSVVSRIRTGNSGWLNTVSSAASSAAGMGSVQTSAVSAVFHYSMPNGSTPARTNFLEHLLVYSPCGRLIQYGLLPCMDEVTGDTASRTGTGPLILLQDEDLKVKSEIIHWWDVCRRADWPEREDCVKGIAFGGKDMSPMVLEASETEDNDNFAKEEKLHEQSTLYLSNAEVQMNYGRIPTWKNSKIHFFAMNSVVRESQNGFVDVLGGEVEIERISHLEIEMNRKDLLPVFEYFHQVKPDWNNRGATRETYPTSGSEARLAEDMYLSQPVVQPQPLRNTHIGSLAPASEMDSAKSYLGLAQDQMAKNRIEVPSTFSPTLLTQNSIRTDTSSMDISPPETSCLVNSPSPVQNGLISAKTANSTEAQSSGSVGGSEASNISSNRSDFSMNVADESSVQDSLDFGGYYQEEYCKAATLDEGHEVITDVDSSSSAHEKEKSEEDADNDELLGGIFAFSEEG